MRLSKALSLTHEMASRPHAREGLGALLDPDIVKQAFETAGVSTIRKRRLPWESLVWCNIGMALFRRMSVWVSPRSEATTSEAPHAKMKMPVSLTDWH